MSFWHNNNSLIIDLLSCHRSWCTGVYASDYGLWANWTHLLACKQFPLSILSFRWNYKTSPCSKLVKYIADARGFSSHSNIPNVQRESINLGLIMLHVTLDSLISLISLSQCNWVPALNNDLGLSVCSVVHKLTKIKCIPWKRPWIMPAERLTLNSNAANGN